MDDAVYKLRRQVIELIYEAKRGGVNLPRISVRIGEQKAKHNVLGVATMKGNQMWITKDAIDLGTDTLRNVVFHEIAHAVYGTDRFIYWDLDKGDWRHATGKWNIKAI